MIKLNSNYNSLVDNYLFAEVARRIRDFQYANPTARVLRLGIGDVTLPLYPSVIAAMHGAVDDMAAKETFKGYGPYEGYDFLREAITRYYAQIGVKAGADEIFVGDGAKSDLGNFLDVFGKATVLVSDPVYPVYVDTNIMAGNKILFANGTRENGFLPLPDKNVRADLVYLCSPNNPTGAVYTRDALKAWVDYANKEGAVILFDCAYEAFIQDKSLPRSIFEIEGARECAVEFCTFSKLAGFTGVRCGYVTIPRELKKGEIAKMWLRRQSTKFNGTSYVTQKGAAAVFTKDGQNDVKKAIGFYLENAKIIKKTVNDLGLYSTGGDNSPYIWLDCKENSWQFFDRLLKTAHVAGTPGAGFGKNGETFFRLTSFGDRQTTLAAAEALKAFFS